MKPGVIAAVFVSFLLIGGALWSRYESVPTANPQLVAVKNSLPDSYYDDMVSKFLNASSTDGTSTEKLTTTDLIGRQMVLDYLSLAQSGQASDDAISALAEKYIQSIPTIITYDKFPSTSLRVVSNDKGNLQTYSDTMQAAYGDYIALVNGAPQGQLSLNGQTLALMSKMAGMYGALAQKMEQMAVPALVAEDHAALINIYLENAQAMQAAARSGTDAASSFAGLIALRKNAEQETVMTSKIKKALEENGI